MTNPKSRAPSSEFSQVIERVKLEDAAYIQAETELERTVSILNSTLESIPDGIVVVDLAGYTLAFNHKFLQMWNLSERLVEPENTQERLAFLTNQVKDAAGYLKKVEEMYARPEAEGYDIVELKDGRIIERHTQPQRLSDKIIGRVWSFRDITGQKQVSDALQRNEANFAAAQRIGHIGNWETNLLTNQLSWSDEIYRIFGLKPQEFSATADAFFAQVHPDDLDYVLKAVGEAIAGGKPYNVDHRIVRASGEIGYVHQEAEVTFDETGQAVRLLGIVQDVTDRKHLELEIQESLEWRGRQVQLSTQIAQDIAAATDLASLYQRVVTQVKEQFGYYHTQLLHYDPAMDVVTLVAGYGKIGAQMLAEDHPLPTGTGLIGTVAALGVSVLRSDISADPNWQANSLLPHTKGELAVPITLGQADVKAQATALDYFINNKIDGFIVCVIDPAVITPITQRALNQGLQVVVQGGDLGEENQTALVGVKEYEVGYLLGIQAGEWAKMHLSPGERLKLGVLHNRFLQPLVQREEGIISGIKATFGNNLEIIGSERAVDPARGLAAAEKWLRDHPHLRMILGVNDGGALGAYQAVIAAGKNDKDAFFIGGVDGVNEALMAIKAGGAYQSTVDQSGSEMGAVAVRALVTAIVKQPYQSVNHIKTSPINSLNVDEFLYKDRQMPIDKSLHKIDLSGIKIALSIQSITNPFYAAMVDGAKQEAAQLGVDLIVNEPKQVLGVLDVQSDVIGALDADDQLMLEGLCGQIAVAIKSTRLLEQTQKRAVEMEIVAQVSTAASTILDTDKLLQEVANLTKEGFGLYHAHIYLLNTAGDTLKLAAGAGEIGRQMVAEGWSIPAAREYSLVARAARTRETVVVDNVHQSIDFMPNPLLPETRSEMAIPLIIGDSVLGVLDVQSDKVNRFSEDDVRVQTTLAAQVAVALRNAGLYQQTQAGLAELQQSQELLRTTIDATPDWIFIKDRTHRYRLVNQGFATSLHLSPEELIGKNDLEVGFPEDVVKGNAEKGIRGFWADDLEVMNSGQTKFVESEPAVIDGRQLFLSTIKVPLRDAGGNVWGLLGFVRDITQREQLLAEAENLYKVSRLINEAKDLQEIVVALADAGPASIINRVLLFTFEHNPLNQVEAIRVAASWHSGQGMPLSPVGRRYMRNTSSLVDLALSREPLFFNDVQHDERMDAGIAAIAQQQNIRAVVILPLQVGSRELGALILQAEEVHEFTQHEMQFYLSLAPQVAVALDNQRLLAETRTALAEVEQTQRRYTVQAWEVYRDRLRTLSYEQVRDGVVPWGDNLLPEITQRRPRTADGRPQLISGGQRPPAGGQGSEVGSSVIIPLTVRGETIGVLGLQEIDGARAWSPEEIALIETISEQVAQTAESIRLIDETQQRAARERRVNEISEKIQAAQSVEEALKIAVKEVGLSLQVPQTTIKLEVQ